MQASNSINMQDSNFFQCYICMQTVKKPRMCPYCSKLACQSCLRTWIEQSRSECPHCRNHLPLGSFADCQRFVNDVKHMLNSIEKAQKTKEKCPQHKIQMQYYCEDCKEAICSDCGMFSNKHRGHSITHLKKIYQQNKNRILNELARYDTKIQAFRKNGYMIKLQMQKLMMQISQKKTFIEEYFLAIIKRLEEQFQQKKDKVQARYDENSQEIEFLQTFRNNFCQELQGKTEKELIVKSEEFIAYIKSLCEREVQMEEEEYTFDTINQIVPYYKSFRYVMKNVNVINDPSIIYSQPCSINGIEWRLKIYPRGNGAAKDTHISVFLEMSKAYSNENKYEYKIELLNNDDSKQSIVRQYSSKFDIGECWGYNHFIALSQLTKGFLNADQSLHFLVNVRNPSYRSLVRDQEQYIKSLENKLSSNEAAPTVERKQQNNQRMNQLIQQSLKCKQNLQSMFHGSEQSMNWKNKETVSQSDISEIPIEIGGVQIGGQKNAVKQDQSIRLQGQGKTQTKN